MAAVLLTHLNHGRIKAHGAVGAVIFATLCIAWHGDIRRLRRVLRFHPAGRGATGTIGAGATGATGATGTTGAHIHALLNLGKVRLLIAVLSAVVVILATLTHGRNDVQLATPDRAGLFPNDR